MEEKNMDDTRSPVKVYNFVFEFFWDKGFRPEAQKSEGAALDGNMLLHMLRETKQSPCACSPLGCCHEVALRNLFKKLREIDSIQEEVEELIQNALEAGGYEPSFLE